MKKFTKLVSAALIMALCFSFTACSSSENKTDADAGSDAASTLVVGTSADYAPYEFMYPDENGEMQFGGIDIEVSKYIADYMGKEVQFENMTFNNLLTSLNKGQFDVVIADIEPNDERREAADFSDPYLTGLPPYFLVKKENVDKFKTYKDFEGKTLGAQTATMKLDTINTIPNANVVSLQSVLDLVKEVSYDKIDAILVDGSVAKQYEATNDDLAALTFEELGAPSIICVAVAKGDPKGLLPQINEAIAKMTEEDKIPEFQKAAEELSDVWQEVSAEE